MFHCRACEAKDDEIKHLRELLESRDRAYLALVDKRAHDARYREERIAEHPKPSEQEPTPEEMMLATPMGVREQSIYQPALDYNRVEELFAAGDGEDLQ